MFLQDIQGFKRPSDNLVVGRLKVKRGDSIFSKSMGDYSKVMWYKGKMNAEREGGAVPFYVNILRIFEIN